MTVYNQLPGVNIIENLNFEEHTGKGIKGIIEHDIILIGSPEFTGFRIEDVQNSGSIVCISINKKRLGYFDCKNHYRENLKNVLQSLSKNYDTHLLSGDNDSEKDRLKDMFSPEKMKFNQQPDDKFNYVQKLKDQNKNVIMMGDGLNDAGALIKSDVGISLADNVYQFSPACDAILSAKSFEKFPHFLSFSKSSMVILYLSFTISFLYNVVGLTYAFMGKLEPVIAAILMPLSSVSVVAFATLSIVVLFKFSRIQNK